MRYIPPIITGSGQQLVTAVQNKRSPKGLWQIREGTGEPVCDTGTPVKCGSVIRLMHLETGSNLHTHGIKSPLSNQHEVRILSSLCMRQLFITSVFNLCAF